jgi:hypothetical protein
MIMWEKALEISSHITHPYTVAAFALVFAAMALLLALKSKRPRIASLLACVLMVLGLSPLVASSILAGRGIYHVRITVLGTDGQPVNQAELTSSSSGELKQANGNWEFDLSPQARPSSGEITFYASVKDAYLAGKSTLALKSDYYPAVTLQLSQLPRVTIRGTVVDDRGRSVSGARVAVSGYSDITTSDEMGNFSLPSHNAEGQMLSIRAEKGDLVAEISAIAGRDAQLVLRKH